MKISEIVAGMKEVEIVGRIVAKENLRNFTQKDGSPGSLAKLTISDGTGQIVLVLWGDKASWVNNYSEGNQVHVTKAYSKINRNVLELNSGKYTTMLMHTPNQQTLPQPQQGYQPVGTINQVNQPAAHQFPPPTAVPTTPAVPIDPPKSESLDKMADAWMRSQTEMKVMLSEIYTKTAEALRDLQNTTSELRGAVVQLAAVIQQLPAQLGTMFGDVMEKLRVVNE